MVYLKRMFILLIGYNGTCFNGPFGIPFGKGTDATFVLEVKDRFFFQNGWNFPIVIFLFFLCIHIYVFIYWCASTLTSESLTWNTSAFLNELNV